ncbi:armadillo-type protein [Dichotomocladium elegans]|nr:armadillo-type protein [Dichotomocladium elegans]
MSNEDRDFRYMALNDLINELQKDTVISMDEAIEGKVVRAVLNLMEDKNGEVQNLAVKCLGPLVKQIRLDHTLEIVDRLSDFAAQKDNEALRGITSMGLKTVITEVEQPLGPKVCSRIIPRLLSMAQSASYEMQMDSLDILAEMFARFGSQVTAAQQNEIQKTLLPLLDHSRSAVRKRTTVAIGHSVVHLTEVMYSGLMAYLLGQLQTVTNSEKLRTLVQCAGVLSTKRFGAYLPQLMPIIVTYASKADEDDELREMCLQSLESFVLRCPTEISPYIGNIIELGLEYLKYDPNYAADDDDDEEDEGMDGEEDDEYGDINPHADECSSGYSDDDDDMSWKVRRSSTKLLAAVIETRSDLLQELYENVSPALISRFKEREESVRVDILQTFIILLRQTGVYSSQASLLVPDSRKSNLYFDASGFGEELSLLPEKVNSSSAMQMDDGPKQLLRAQVPKLASALSKQLSSKSTQTRQIGFHLLRELVYILQGGLENEIELFVPAIEASLTTGSSDQQQVTLTSNLKIEVLAFLRQLFSTHSAESLHPYLNHFSPAIINTVSDKFYKIISEAFLLCIELIKVIRPIKCNADTGDYEIAPVKPEFTPYLLSIYQATLKVLGTSDADQEVKERSIMCLGALLSQVGDVLQSEQRHAWGVFLDRLRNEVTRLISVRTLTIICQSPVAAGEELQRCVLTATDEVGLLLRKSNRSLRIASAECLRILVQRFGQHLSEESYRNLLDEIRPLISDNDLHLLPLALRTVEALIIVRPASVQDTKEAVLPALFNIIQSPLLQGTSLDSLLDLFAAISKASPTDYQMLVKGLVGPLLDVHTSGISAGGVAAVANKQAATTVAQCVAVLAVNTEARNCEDTIRIFNGYIQDSSANDSVKYLSLLTLGEIGRRINLSSIDDIQEHILSLFATQSEEVKFAAAFALGNISVGNIEKYLPLIVSQIKEQPKRRYLLLHSLKEIITRSDKNTKLRSASDEIWTLLLESSDSEQEEGTRSVVAECLGKLTLTNPTRYLPELQDVQRLALLTMNSGVHRKPYLIKNILKEMIPLLYDETVIKEELIHTVEMGPFKHKVDDGLEIRKAAYECMYTLLSTCLDRIEIHGFLDRVRAGLEDQHDIKMLTYLMISRLVRVAPTAVQQRLDDFVDPLKATLDTKMRSNAVKQEVEKNQELVRATLRCMVSLNALSDAGMSPRFDGFMKALQSGPLAEEYKKTMIEVDNRETTRGAGDYMDLS